MMGLVNADDTAGSRPCRRNWEWDSRRLGIFPSTDRRRALIHTTCCFRVDAYAMTWMPSPLISMENPCGESRRRPRLPVRPVKSSSVSVSSSDESESLAACRYEYRTTRPSGPREMTGLRREMRGRAGLVDLGGAGAGAGLEPPPNPLNNRGDPAGASAELDAFFTDVPPISFTDVALCGDRGGVPFRSRAPRERLADLADLDRWDCDTDRMGATEHHVSPKSRLF